MDPKQTDEKKAPQQGADENAPLRHKGADRRTQEERESGPSPRAMAARASPRRSLRITELHERVRGGRGPGPEPEPTRPGRRPSVVAG